MLAAFSEKPEHKEFLAIVTKELDKKGNNLVKYAEAQKSIPEAASIVAISGFLGWFLPWFNINYTTKLYKDKEKHPLSTFGSLTFAPKPEMSEKFKAFTGLS